MISRFFGLFVLVGTTFARTAAATVEVWPEGKMPGNGAKEPEADARLPLFERRGSSQ